MRATPALWQTSCSKTASSSTTSTGSPLGRATPVNYVSRDIDRTKRSFVDLVKDPEFGGVGTFLQHKGFFSAKHIYEEAGLSGGFLPFDFVTFAANPAKVTIESFDRDTGKSVYWTKDNMQTIEDLMVRVRASSTLPLVMPSPKIGASHYYDGGLGEGPASCFPARNATASRASSSYVPVHASTARPRPWVWATRSPMRCCGDGPMW